MKYNVKYYKDGKFQGETTQQMKLWEHFSVEDRMKFFGHTKLYEAYMKRKAGKK